MAVRGPKLVADVGGDAGLDAAGAERDQPQADGEADAGIVQSPGGDYALVMFMWANVDWLDYQISFPLMQDISAVTFNYFNPDLVDEPRIGWLNQ